MGRGCFCIHNAGLNCVFYARGSSRANGAGGVLTLSVGISTHSINGLLYDQVKFRFVGIVKKSLRHGRKQKLCCIDTWCKRLPETMRYSD